MIMTNQEIARIFYEIADMMELQGKAEDRYRVLAYRRAADQIEHHPRDLADVWREGKLQEIPGIGEAIAKKIEQILHTGHLELHDKLKEEIPDGVLSFLAIPEVGPKTAKRLWEDLGLTSIVELEEAARAGKVRTLKGMGPKTEENILRGIQLLHRRSTRILLASALPAAEELMAGLRECPQAKNVTAAGSLRRCVPTIGDLDLLAASDKPEKVIDAFVHLPRVAEVQAKGDTKATVILDNGIQVDLRVLPKESYGALLQYFTGSKAHNIQLRELAQDRGLSLSEYGFTRADGQQILCPTEEEVYKTLGLPWIPPELREASGEIEAAQRGKLPKLIDPDDVKGDLQMHTTASDGVSSVEEMAQAAMALGYQYIAITDHSKGLGIAKGLTPERLRKQRVEIDAVNKKLAPFRVLAGAEVEIRADGTLDLPDEVLAELDVVLASVHSGMRQDKEVMTRRVLRAIQNPHVDILAHPTGRLIGQREPIAIDFDAVAAEAAKRGVILEINAQPNRLDLDGEHVRLAKQKDALLSLGSDAHHAEGLKVLELGVAMARRGWAEARDVVNTLPVDKLLKRLQRRM
jgi:DNA polymerase (family 10)